jgi:chemotaxis protein histidine kinase CheA
VLTDDPPVPPAGPAFLGGDKLKITPIDLPPTAWYPGLKKFAQEAEQATAEKTVATAIAALDNNATVLNSARHTTALAQLDSLRARLTADNARGTGNFDKLAQTAHRAEQLAALHAAHEKVAQAHQAISNAKKDADKKKAQTQLAAAKKSAATAETALKKESTSYTLLSPTYPKKSSGRRTALAKWITDPKNPLTARVAANHIWARHFRQPLAEPVYDLGSKGTAPSHPQLLDYLASELIKNNWRMKPFHRLIVTSEAYKRASAIPQSTKRGPLSIDPDNKLVWRMNPGRAEAEVIRDSILHAAGSLDKKFGGPVIDSKSAPSSRRRALYFTTFPEAGGRTQFIALFDAPDPCDCYLRTTSIIPQQALAMANSKLAQDQSRILAKKLWIATGQETDFINATFEQLLTRPPRPQELQLCQSFLKKQATLFKENKKSKPAQRARESLVHSLFSHNDFITVR